MKGVSFSDGVALAAAILSLAALVCSVLSYLLARQAHGLAERQEERRKPRLQLRLLAAQFVRRPNERFYSFEIELTNPTDAANTVTAIELMLRYKRELPMALRLPAAPAHGSAAAALIAPIRLETNGAALGTASFIVPNKLIKDATIEGYEVVVRDAHQNPSGLEIETVWDRTDEA